MKRKIIRQGHNTLTVTLPSKWAAKNGIKPGDEVDITENETSLVIGSSPKGAGGESITVDISGLTPPIIWRMISSAYRAGYSEIKVIGLSGGKKNVYSAF